jgi:signal peptidase I
MSTVKALVRELIETLVLSVALILLIYRVIASIEIVYGASMEPNFHTGQRILVDKVTKYFKDYQRGEVVVLRPMGEEDKHFIKRVVGLPGDIIKLYDCSVFVSIDGKRYQLVEDYLAPKTCTIGGLKIKDGRATKLEKDQFLVLGDNRGSSVDSRFLGLVERKSIVGRVVFRFWPITFLGFIR